MNTFSTAANLPLPRWAYVPGESADAEADHDTLWHAKALVPSRFRDFIPARHPALRYGIALNDAGYFWESHEVLEAVWAAAPQGGRERILLRACIQIASANLKLRMQKPHAAARLLGEALVELKALGARKDSRCRRRICRWLPDRRAGSPADVEIGSSRRSPRPIGWRSALSAGHEAKCRLRASQACTAAETCIIVHGE